MVNKFIAQYVIKHVLRQLVKRFKPLEKYVFEDNELDESVKRIQDKVNDLEKRIDVLDNKENKNGEINGSS